MVQKPDLPAEFPNRTQAQAQFDANVVAFLNYLRDLDPYLAHAIDQVAATALAGDLPPLAGQGGLLVAAAPAEDAATFLSPSLFSGMRSRLINGDFSVWQRGTSFADVQTEYTADRWQVVPATGQVDVSRQPHDPADQPPGAGRYFLRFDQVVAGAGSFLRQRIEGVHNFAGETVTVTFWARHVTAGPTSLRVIVDQFFGTGGAPSAQVSSAAIEILGDVTSTGWQKFSVALTLPSIAGKVLGTDGNDYLALRIANNTDEVFDLDVADVSMVPGDATNDVNPIDRRPVGLERLLCFRYFYRNTNFTNGHGFKYGEAGTGVEAATFNLPVPMRETPTCSLTGATFQGTGAPTGVGFSVNEWGGTITTTLGATGRYRVFGGDFQADAEL